MNNFLAVSFGITLFVAYAASDPSECYSCDDTTTCNDPLDVSAAIIKNCSTSPWNGALMESSLSQSFHLGAVNKSIKLQKLCDTTNKTCIKVSANNNGVKETWRDCFYKNLDGLEFCEFASLILTDWTNFTCSTCDTDLCNTS